MCLRYANLGNSGWWKAPFASRAPATFLQQRGLAERHINISHAEFLSSRFLSRDRFLKESVKRVLPPKIATYSDDMIKNGHIFQLAAAISVFEDAARCSVHDRIHYNVT